jgi:hypothetical protein
MLIRSQDGIKLINFFNVDKIMLYEDCQEENDILVYFKGNAEIIATYSKKEKALSVLADILLEYEHVGSYQMPPDEV